MLKSLFHILLFFACLGTSANASNIQLLASDFEFTVIDSPLEQVYSVRSTQNHFFDVEREVVFTVLSLNAEFLDLDVISLNLNGLLSHSNYLSQLQRFQSVIAGRNNYKTHYLRVTLFPFHSFW